MGGIAGHPAAALLVQGYTHTTVGLKNEGASKGALGMKFFDKFKKQETEAGTVVYAVEQSVVKS